MTAFGNFFGSLLGYILWAFYVVFKNYGVAIILFTILLKVAMFPFSIKQQKSMAANSKMAAKQKEIQAKYANDKVKMQEEMQKLYEKEGVNPMGGCLPMLIPFPIMIGLYYTVINPLSNALHLGKEAVAQSVAVLQQIPGIGSTFQSFYGEIEIVKHFNELRPFLTMFNAGELERIEDLSRGFNFLGLNLLGTPASISNGFFNAIVQMFQTNLWIIPVFCLVSSWVTQIISTKLQPGMQQQQQGCMMLMLYGMPLFSAYIALTVPAAVGFYWIISTLTQLLQTVILHKFYSPAHMTAKTEAQRIALLEKEEATITPLSPAEQKKLSDKLMKNNKSLPQQTEKKAEPRKTSGSSGKGKGKASGGTSDYLGSKK